MRIFIAGQLRYDVERQVPPRMFLKEEIARDSAHKARNA
jgi:hypothetical protein